jgi:Spy/CpxP family protein refolding chaperone
MFRKLIVLCVAAALAGTLALAQSSGSGMPPAQFDPATITSLRVNQLASQLSLTDAQKAQATTIYTNAYKAALTIGASMQTDQQSLRAAVKANDIAAIDSVAAAIGKLQGQAIASNSKADAAFYALLTTAQQTQYDAMTGGLGGRGGAGGPGGTTGNAGRGGPPPQ